MQPRNKVQSLPNEKSSGAIKLQLNCLWKTILARDTFWRHTMKFLQVLFLLLTQSQMIILWMLHHLTSHLTNTTLLPVSLVSRFWLWVTMTALLDLHSKYYPLQHRHLLTFMNLSHDYYPHFKLPSVQHFTTHKHVTYIWPLNNCILTPHNRLTLYIKPHSWPSCRLHHNI